MIKSITAIERDGFDIRTLTVECKVPDGNFDLLSAIRSACTDYIQTDAGKAVYEYNCSCFNLADFCTNVPNEICEKHGFSKLNDVYCEDDIDWDYDFVL